MITILVADQRHLGIQIPVPDLSGILFLLLCLKANVVGYSISKARSANRADVWKYTHTAMLGEETPCHSAWPCRSTCIELLQDDQSAEQCGDTLNTVWDCFTYVKAFNVKVFSSCQNYESSLITFSILWRMLFLFGILKYSSRLANPILIVLNKYLHL